MVVHTEESTSPVDLNPRGTMNEKDSAKQSVVEPVIESHTSKPMVSVEILPSIQHWTSFGPEQVPTHSDVSKHVPDP